MSSKRRTEYQTSENFVNGRFQYPVETSLSKILRCGVPGLLKGNIQKYFLAEIAATALTLKRLAKTAVLLI